MRFLIECCAWGITRDSRERDLRGHLLPAILLEAASLIWVVRRNWDNALRVSELGQGFKTTRTLQYVIFVGLAAY